MAVDLWLSWEMMNHICFSTNIGGNKLCDGLHYGVATMLGMRFCLVIIMTTCSIFCAQLIATSRSRGPLLKQPNSELPVIANITYITSTMAPTATKLNLQVKPTSLTYKPNLQVKHTSQSYKQNKHKWVISIDIQKGQYHLYHQQTYHSSSAGTVKSAVLLSRFVLAFLRL